MALQDKKNQIKFSPDNTSVLITEILQRLTNMHQGLVLAKVTSESS